MHLLYGTSIRLVLLASLPRVGPEAVSKWVML